MNTINTANVIGKAINTGSGKRNTDAGIMNHVVLILGLSWIPSII